jgi:hypothetical protein
METRAQAVPLFTAICVLIGVLVVLQLWLLATSVEAVLAGEAGAATPAAIASAVLLAVNAALLRYVSSLDRRVRQGERSSAS